MTPEQKEKLHNWLFLGLADSPHMMGELVIALNADLATLTRERDEARLQAKNLSEDLARLHEAADKLRKDRDEAIGRADGLRMILNMEREKNEPT